jgi:hypothetical protein
MRNRASEISRFSGAQLRAKVRSFHSLPGMTTRRTQKPGEKRGFLFQKSDAMPLFSQSP